jgi:tRNA1(Val) A37 N6-methylase TrmN6
MTSALALIARLPAVMPVFQSAVLQIPVQEVIGRGYVPVSDNNVDLVITSPPYWRKREYGLPGQIGQESTAHEYVEAIITALREWRRVLRPTGSVMLIMGRGGP